jgi:CheY-like chemotaxis protein
MEKKILLVDDEAEFLELMALCIKEWGYDLITALSGKEAIEALKKKNPDIIVLDYIMPGMDGVATLKEMRKINSTIPVIMFTAYPDKRSICGVEKLGVSAYIPKLSSYSDAHTALKTALHMAEDKLNKPSE